MDTFIIILIILIGVINALAHAFKDKKRKEAGEKGPRSAGKGELSPLEKFLKMLQEGGTERRPFIPEEKVIWEAPEPPKIPPVKKRQVSIPVEPERMRPGLSEKFKELPSFKLEELRETGITPIPLIVTPTPAPLTMEPALEIDAATIKYGVVMAEILGPPLAKRKAGNHARRLF